MSSAKPRWIRNVLFGIVLGVVNGAAGAPVSQAAAGETPDLEACRVGFTPFGRQAEFAGVARYSVVTDADGRVPALTVPPESRAANDRLSIFTELPELEDCIESWTLAGETRYTVEFHAGTVGPAAPVWSITTCDADGDCVRIRLPRIDRPRRQQE